MLLCKQVGKKRKPLWRNELGAVDLSALEGKPRIFFPLLPPAPLPRPPPKKKSIFDAYSTAKLTVLSLKKPLHSCFFFSCSCFIPYIFLNFLSNLSLNVLIKKVLIYIYKKRVYLSYRLCSWTPRVDNALCFKRTTRLPKWSNENRSMFFLVHFVYLVL